MLSKQPCSKDRDAGAVNDQQLGLTLRTVRIHRRMRQADVAQAARVSPTAVSRLERGHIGSTSLDVVRSVAGVLEMRLDLVPRWRGGDLDWIVNRRHSALHERLADRVVRVPDWISAAEVSFSIYGERGVIDRLAFHPGRQMLGVFEIKADLSDPPGVVAQVDRYRRLALRVGRDRGWIARDVSCWLVVADTVTNRRRFAAHEQLMREAFPFSTRELQPWLINPVDRRDGLAFLSYPNVTTARGSLTAIKRVRPRRRPSREREIPRQQDRSPEFRAPGSSNGRRMTE